VLALTPIIANIYILGRLHQNKPLIDDSSKIVKIIVFFVAIIVMSSVISISLFSFISYLRSLQQEANSNAGGTGYNNTTY
jgi:hypothetical protein